jgi:hypothetical protein
MPAIAPLVVKDAVGAGVDHTFAPTSTNGSKSEFSDRSTATPAGFRKIHHEVLPSGSNRPLNGITIGFYDPRETVVDGVTVITSSNSAKVTLNLAPDSTVQERKNLLAYVANTLGLASIKTTIENIEPFY